MTYRRCRWHRPRPGAASCHPSSTATSSPSVAFTARARGKKESALEATEANLARTAGPPRPAGRGRAATRTRERVFSSSDLRVSAAARWAFPAGRRRQPETRARRRRGRRTRRRWRGTSWRRSSIAQRLLPPRQPARETRHGSSCQCCRLYLQEQSAGELDQNGTKLGSTFFLSPWAQLHKRIQPKFTPNSNSSQGKTLSRLVVTRLRTTLGERLTGWLAAASPMPLGRTAAATLCCVSVWRRAAAAPDSSFSFVACDASSAGSLGKEWAE